MFKGFGAASEAAQQQKLLKRELSMQDMKMQLENQDRTNKIIQQGIENKRATEEFKLRERALEQGKWTPSEGVDPATQQPIKGLLNTTTGEFKSGFLQSQVAAPPTPPLLGVAPSTGTQTIRSPLLPAPKATESPLGASVANLNMALTDRFQVLNPGQKLPPQYTLPANASQRDFDRVDKMLQQVEQAKGTKAQQDTANAMRGTMLALAAGKQEKRDESIETLAKSIVRPGNLTALRLVTSMRDDTRSHVYARALELDPNFDAGLIEQRIKFLGQYENPTGRAALNRQSINNIMQHAGDLVDVNKAYTSGRGDARFWNTAVNKIAQQFGNTAYIDYTTTLGVLKDELALYFSGGYAPQKAQIDMWEKIQNDNATPGQINAFAKEVVHLGLRRASTFNSQFKTNMGIDDPNMITPDAKQAASKLGLEGEVSKFGSGGQLTGGGQAPSAKPQYKVGDSVMYNGKPHKVKSVLTNGKLELEP